MPRDDHQSERELVAKSCRMLGKLKLTKGSMGHVSQRTADGQHILVRAKGLEEVGVRYTSAEHIIKVDLDGNMVEGADGLEAPGEILLHTWLYKMRPETRSVVHVHPLNALLLTICRKPLLPLFGGYDPGLLSLVLDGIPTYQRSITIRNDKLGEEFSKAMGSKKACLMRGHGITTAGRSVEEATITAIQVNEIADINYRAHLLGGAEPIDDEDVAEFRERKTNRTEPAPSRETATARLASAWRYYTDVAGESAD
jgi:ribulose-5-phosphate 4-epimerase/fuculose-1-phosphate aldolase